MDTERSAEQARPQAGTVVEAEPQTPALPGQDDQAAIRLARIERLLEGILEHMHHVRREEQTREFGLADIFAALAQVIAIAAVLAAVLALLKTQPDRGLAALGLLGATAMQGLALTLFLLKRRL